MCGFATWGASLIDVAGAHPPAPDTTWLQVKAVRGRDLCHAGMSGVRKWGAVYGWCELGRAPNSTIYNAQTLIQVSELIVLISLL